MGLSAPGEMRLNLEESGVGSQQDQTVSTLFPPANAVSGLLRSHLLKKSDTSQVGDYSPMSFTYYASGERRDIGDKTPDGGEPFAGPGLCRDLSSDASHVRASSRGVRGALSKKSIELSGIEVSPSAGQREETSMSERPYQRDGAFVDHQSGGYTIEVNEYVSPVKDDEKVAEVKSDPSGIAGGVHIRSGGASLSKVEMGSGYDCRHCSRKFSSERGLETHQGRLHKKKMGSGYDCRYCSRKFSTKRGLETHQGRLHKKKMGSGYDCRYCSRKFSTKRGLETHQGRLHKKERQQAESAEIQAGRSAVNQNTATSLQCYPMQPVQDMQLPPWGILTIPHAPRRGFEEGMAGRIGHDPQPVAMFHSELSNYSPNSMSYPSTPMPWLNALPCSAQQQLQGPSRVYPDPPKHLRTVLAPTATATIQWRPPPGEARGLDLPTPPMRSTFNNSSMTAGPPTTSRTFLQNVPPRLPCQSSQPSGEASVSRVELQSDHVRYSLYQQRHQQQPMAGHRGHDPQPIAMFHSELSNYSPNPMSCSSTSMPSLNAPPGSTAATAGTL